MTIRNERHSLGIAGRQFDPGVVPGPAAFRVTSEHNLTFALSDALDYTTASYSFSGTGSATAEAACIGIIRTAMLAQQCLRQACGMNDKGLTESASPSYVVEASQPGEGYTGAAGSAPLPAARTVTLAALKTTLAAYVTDLQACVDQIDAIHDALP